MNDALFAELVQSLKEGGYIKRLLSLERKVAKLEKRIAALEPKPLPVAVYYKDGKPMKGKGKK